MIKNKVHICLLNTYVRILKFYPVVSKNPLLKLKHSMYVSNLKVQLIKSHTVIEFPKQNVSKTTYTLAGIK